jgi:hypothetical protein
MLSGCAWNISGNYRGDKLYRAIRRKTMTDQPELASVAFLPDTPLSVASRDWSDANCRSVARQSCNAAEDRVELPASSAAPTQSNRISQDAIREILNNHSLITGKKMWGFGTGDCVASSPCVAEGTVYVGSNDNKLYAIDFRTGHKKWEFKTGNYVESSPRVVDGIAYVGSDDRSLYAIQIPGSPKGTMTEFEKQHDENKPGVEKVDDRWVDIDGVKLPIHRNP